MARCPLICRNDKICHINSYVYLGIPLDAEMSLGLYAAHLYNRIQVKIFTLSKITKFIDTNYATIIYRRTTRYIRRDIIFSQLHIHPHCLFISYMYYFLNFLILSLKYRYNL